MSSYSYASTSKVKTRSTYSINYFRGLDKESKLLKVAKYRATEGSNFIIDSETLKTRPAFKYDDDLPFAVETDDNLISWKSFNDITIYLTKNHIYVYDGTDTINEKDSKMIVTPSGVLDFSNSTPFFKEEKECLFIFVVGFIYVFSTFYNSEGNPENYIFYELGDKPTNLFFDGDDHYQDYEDLPTPYVPTIMIGNDTYEDINLLSRKRKYQLYASTKEAIDGTTTYTLPTTYTESNNGSYGAEVSFYDDRFTQHNIYPIFLGVEDEDLVDIEANYGSTINELDPYVIEDIFFPAKDFEYTVLAEDITTLANPVTVSSILSLGKEWFFKSRVNIDNKQVFEFLINYINLDQSLATPLISENNKTMKFLVPIKYTAVYTDISTYNVVARKVKEDVVAVYIQLKKFAVDEIAFNLDNEDASDTKIEYDLESNYPNYPTTTGTYDDLYLSANPINSGVLSQEAFRILVNSYLQERKFSYADGQKLRIYGRLYNSASSEQEQIINPEASTYWDYKKIIQIDSANTFLSDEIITYNFEDDFPDYQYVAGEYTIIDLYDVPQEAGVFADNEINFNALCSTYMTEHEEDFSDGEQVKFRIQYKDSCVAIVNESITEGILSLWTFATYQNFSYSEVSFSDKITVLPESTTYPDYPTTSTGYTLIELENSPFYLENYTSTDFTTKCQEYLVANRLKFEDGELVKFLAKYKENVEVAIPEAIDVSTSDTWIFKEQNFLEDFTSYEGTEQTLEPLYYDTYSGYPYTIIGTRTDIEFQPYQTNSFSISEFLEQVDYYFASNLENLTDGEELYFRGVQTIDNQVKGFIVTCTVQKGIYDKKGIMIGYLPSYPSYPYISNPDSLQVLFLGDVYTCVGSSFDFSSDLLKTAIKSAISIAIDSLTNESGYAYASCKASLDSTLGSSDDTAYSFAVKFYYEKEGTEIYESRQSMVLVSEIERLTYAKEGVITDVTTFPDYPVIDYGTSESIDFGLVYSGTTETVDFESTALLEALTLQVSDRIDELTASNGTFYAKFKVFNSYNGVTTGYSMIAPVEYVKYSSSPYEVRQSLIRVESLSDIIYEKEVTLNDATSYPDYPIFDNTELKEVVDLGIINTQTSQSFIYDDLNLENSLIAKITNNLDSFTNATGNIIAKFKIQKSYNGTVTGVSAVAEVYYQKYVETPYENRRSFVYQTTVDTDQQEIGEKPWSLLYEEKYNSFIFKLKDYFFDYNDEPCIEIKITFTKNEDSKLVTNNKIGTTFGSENRLFIAGDTNYPNIDRFNVSNDLLGDNIKSQSYETTYFPSKNFRVLGGKGAINGYVVATDSQLYVTKEKYSNDEKFFIRERNVTDGEVSYIEYKTSVKITPLNENCIVRFYNDVLILSEEGLYGVNISSNVLTDERLVVSRDGFIKKDLIEKISNYDKDKIFMIENDKYLYICIGEDIYVADSRYIEKNEDGDVGNYSYEIVKWVAPTSFLSAQVDNSKVIFLDSQGKGLYSLVQTDEDDLVTRENDFLYLHDIQDTNSNSFLLPDGFEYLIENPNDYIFTMKAGFKLLGTQGIDYHIDESSLIVDNSIAFRSIVDEDKVYFKDNSTGSFIETTVSGYDDSGISFEFDSGLDLDLSKVYTSIANVPLRISLVVYLDNAIYFRLGLYKLDEVETVEIEENESLNDYLVRLSQKLADNNDYFFATDGLQDVYINKPTAIVLTWISAITALGNQRMEKTMFRANVFASRQNEGNSLTFGYRTMKKANYTSTKVQDVSNVNNFNLVDFNHYGLNTFSEFGSSFRMKENNFLYIQLEIVGVGQIELNSIEILYKKNRLLKSIG